MYSLTDLQLVNAVVESVDYRINLTEFTNINSQIQGSTIISVLLSICRRFDGYSYSRITLANIRNKLPNWHVDSDDIHATILENIRSLLSHPDIDFSVKPNAEALFAVMIHHCTDAPYITNDMLSSLLEHHNWNFNVVIKKNAIQEYLRAIKFTKINVSEVLERIKIFTKYGARMEYGVDDTDDHNVQPYVLASHEPIIFDRVILYTNYFYGLETALLRKLDIEHDGVKIFENILQYGKISSLQYLGTESEKISAYEQWLKSFQTFDADEMRKCFGVLVNNFEVTIYGHRINNIIRKICLFKCNLECLIQSTITVPAYKFYDVAIIVLFLMRNQHLTILTCDVLRYIAAFVFS